MQEITLSNNLAQIELEINHHKQIAGQSIWEIGRRLNHVKENDLVHGQFMDWYQGLGIDKDFASKSMKVAKELPNFETLRNLGTTALHLIATLPDEAKQEQLDRIEQGDNPTVRELQAVKKKYSQLRKGYINLQDENERLKSQPTETKVVEREVVPDDYHATQQLNKQLLDKNKDLTDQVKAAEERAEFVEGQLQQLYAERAEVDEKSAKYDELTRAIETSKGQLDNYQKQISAYRDILGYLEKGNKFLSSFGGLVYVDVKPALANPRIKSELETFAVMVSNFNHEVQNLLKDDDILEGEIL